MDRLAFDRFHSFAGLAVVAALAFILVANTDRQEFDLDPQMDQSASNGRGMRSLSIVSAVSHTFDSSV